MLLVCSFKTTALGHTREFRRMGWRLAKTSLMETANLLVDSLSIFFYQGDRSCELVSAAAVNVV